MPLTGPTRGVAPCPVARGASRWLLPGGAARAICRPPRVRGGRIEVIVAWRRARRLGRLCHRHQPPPGDAGEMPRCPGLAPSRIRRWCARRVPVMPATGSGRDAIPGPAPDDRPGPPSRAAGRGHDTGAAVTCPFTAMARIWRGCPGAAGMAWRDWRWRAASASCGQPLVPTGLPGPVWFFSNHAVLAGAPLRNRTVDLLLTMGNQRTCGQQRPWTGRYPACASVAREVREWLGEAGRGHH